MDRLRAPQCRPLHVIDRVLAAQHEDEEERGEAPRGGDHPPRPEAVPEAEPGHVEARPVHELLEHERVLPLLDDLVVDVAELGRAVGQRPGELEEAALEDVLELRPDLHLGRDQVEPEAGARRLRLRAIPRRRAEHVVRAELPARVLGVDAVVGGVPVDVGVGVEVLDDRLVAEPPQEMLVGGGDLLLLRQRVARSERDGRFHVSSSRVRRDLHGPCQRGTGGIP